MRTIAAAAFGALICLPATAQAELLVNISKTQQQLSVVVDGALAYRWPISTGRARNPTPAGKFRPFRLEKDWYSRKYNMTPMPYSMFFHKGYAVHGTLEARNLGRAVSHGCVRLLPANASLLFALVREHGLNRTQFVVMNGPLPKGSVPHAPKPPSGSPGVAQSDDVPLPMVRVAHHAVLPDDAPVTAVDAMPVAASEPAAVQARKPEPSVQVAMRHDAAREADEDAAEPQTIAGDEPAIGAPIASAPAEPEPAPPVAAKPAPVPKRAAIHPVEEAPKETHRAAPVRARAISVNYSVSVGSEAQVLREREAWLRSLDRKYGIGR